MYCAQCGVNNDRGESSCYICGAAIHSSAAFAPDVPGKPARQKAAPAGEKQATVGDRTLALLFDHAILIAILSLLAAWRTSQGVNLDPNLMTVVAMASGTAFLLMLLYYVLLEAAFGNTLGKAMMALSVRTTGQRGRFVAAVLRNFMRIVDSIGFYLVGFLFAMFTARGQRVGDLVGGTVVMEGRSNTPLRAGLMVLWLVIVVATIWFAYSICPSCRVMVPR